LTSFLTHHGVIVALVCAAAAVVYGIFTSRSLLALSPGNEAMRSISAAVGFIALLGQAVLNGVLMVSAINHRLEDGEALHDAVEGDPHRDRDRTHKPVPFRAAGRPAADRSPLTRTTGGEIDSQEIMAWMPSWLRASRAGSSKNRCRRGVRQDCARALGLSRPQPVNVRTPLEVHGVMGTERDGLIQSTRQAR